METLRCRKEAITARIAHDDSRLLRSDLDYIAIGHCLLCYPHVGILTDSRPIRSRIIAGMPVDRRIEESSRRHATAMTETLMSSLIDLCTAPLADNLGRRSRRR